MFCSPKNEDLIFTTNSRMITIDSQPYHNIVNIVAHGAPTCIYHSINVSIATTEISQKSQPSRTYILKTSHRTHIMPMRSRESGSSRIQHELKFVWSFEQGSEAISRSPVFTRHEDNDFQWQMAMAPYGVDKHSLLLYQLGDDESNPITSLNIGGKLYISSGGRTKTMHPLMGNRIYTPWSTREERSPYLLHRLDRIAPHDSLDIHIQLKYELRYEFTASTVCRDQISFLERLFNDGLYSDVKVIVGEREFQVHKCILGVNSEHFRTMFSHDTKEAREGVVNIKEFSPEVVELILRYIYTGKISFQTFELTSELCQAADMYNLQELKDAGSRLISGFINQGKALQVLRLAHYCNLPKLRIKALEYFRENPSELFEENDWTDLIKNEPDFVAKVFESLRLSE